MGKKGEGFIGTIIKDTWIITRGGAQKIMEFIYKKCIFTLMCLNFSHLQSTLYLIQYTYQYIFSTGQNRF